MEDKQIHNEEARKLALQNTKDKIGQANGLWAEEFHYQLFKILAPNGFEPKRVNNSKVARLDYLTENRIKKAANVAHNIMKMFKQQFLSEMVSNYIHIQAERVRVLEAIKRERSYPFWKRHKKLLAGLALELEELEIQLRTLNGIEGILQTVLPEDADLTDDMIQRGIEKVNEISAPIKPPTPEVIQG